MLQTATVAPGTLELLGNLQGEPLLRNTRLVGGTAFIGFIHGVKIDVIYHPFPWLEEAMEEDGFRIAAKTDIVAMKMHAIINSGTRPKDFVDIAFLSMYFSYNEMK